MTPESFIPSSARPIDKPNIKPFPLNTHNARSEAIRAVRILGPHYRWPRISKPKEIVLSEADHLQMKVTVDGIVPNEILLNDLLSIHGVP